MSLLILGHGYLAILDKNEVRLPCLGTLVPIVLYVYIPWTNLQIHQQFWLSICSITRLHQIEAMAPEAGRMSGNLLIQDRPSVPIHQPVPSLQPATQITQEVRNRNLLNTMFKVSLKDEMLWQEPFKWFSLSIWFWCLFFSVQKRRPPATIYPRYNKSSKELLFFSRGEHWSGFYDITYKITVWGKYSLQESNITLLCRSWQYWRTWSARKRCSTREIRVWSFAPNPWRLHSTKERFMLQKSGNTWPSIKELTFIYTYISATS